MRADRLRHSVNRCGVRRSSVCHLAVELAEAPVLAGMHPRSACALSRFASFMATVVGTRPNR